MAHSNKRQISLFLNDAQLTNLNDYSSRIGISRQKLLESLINSGLDDLSLMDQMGLIAICVGVRDFIYKIKNKEI